MKKILIVAMALSGSLCFGAQNDTIVTFSTKGPDTYKDGTKVLDGESYALVWTANGATFGGFNADGTLVAATDKMVLVAALAKDGKCPTTLFEIDAKDAEQYKGGTFALYLLDTRVKDAAGNVMLASKQTFALAASSVNAAGKVSGDATVSGGEQMASIAGGTTKLAEVGSYAKLGEPTITGFAVKGANIEITVKDMYEAADYFVVPGSTPTEFSPALEVKPQGNTFKFKPSDDAKFFKVIGVRKFE